MTPELEKKLYFKYPLLYGDRNAPMSQTCMCWGFDCSDGWYDIVDRLSSKLETLIKEYKEEYPHLPCNTCGCEKEEHYGCLSPRPGKCLAVKKVPTKYISPYRYSRRKLFFIIFPIFRLWNWVTSKFFYKYQTCWCEQYRHPHPRAIQVKEKFGGLRFYMTYELNGMEELIRVAEEESIRTCEVCGKEGIECVRNYWYKTLCDQCRSTQGYKVCVSAD